MEDSDSIIVTFDNNRKQTYTNITTPDRVNISPTEGNILLNDAYEVISNELYEFTFTEEDYKNAADIEG